MSSPRARPTIEGISPYVQGQSDIPGIRQPIKLSSNESSWGPSPAAIAAYQGTAPSLARYPDGTQCGLREAIAHTFHLEPEGIVCGNGSDEIILLLMRAFVAPGDEVIISEHSFVMARTHALAQGARVVTIPEPGYGVDVDAVLRRVTGLTRLVVLASPNNPCGVHLSGQELERLHAGLPRETLLLCDAAYADFVTDDGYDCGFRLARMFENFMVTRTFSKLYGLAGLRIGWGYAPAAILEPIERIRTPFNTNVAALAAATAAVRDVDYAAYVRRENARWRELMTEGYRRLGLHVVPSSANFLLVRFPGGSAQAMAAFDHFKSRGIIVRPTGSDALDDHLRITIGTAVENEAVLAALSDFMKTG